MNEPEELAGLPEDVREAVVRIDSNNAHACAGVAQFGRGERHAVFVAQCVDYQRVRAELLRLTSENADLKSNIELDEQVWVQREETMEKWIRRARSAETELAALKRRIAEAQQTTVAWSGGYGCRLDVMADMPVGESPIIGKRVALLPVGGE